jgi:hypothetical protein
MIPEAREVRLRPKIRKVLEARCQAIPNTRKPRICFESATWDWPPSVTATFTQNFGRDVTVVHPHRCLGNNVYANVMPGIANNSCDQGYRLDLLSSVRSAQSWFFQLSRKANGCLTSK